MTKRFAPTFPRSFLRFSLLGKLLGRHSPLTSFRRQILVKGLMLFDLGRLAFSFFEAGHARHAACRTIMPVTFAHKSLAVIATEL
jgi:hypothetical protein